MYDGPFHDDEYARDICDAGGGNYFVVGYTEGMLYVLKINSFGDTLWTKVYQNYDISEACVSSSDGGCVIAGYDYLVKIGAAGSIIWDVDSIGVCYDIIQTNDNGFIACGTKNVFNGYLIKVNSGGIIQWERMYISGYARAYSVITIANDGGYIAGGNSFESPTDTNKALLTKINESGDTLWEKKYLIQNKYANISGIVNIDNGYAIIGSTDDSLGIVHIFANAYFAKADNNGNILFSKIYYTNRTEFVRCLKKRNNNNFIFSVYRAQQFMGDSTYAKFFSVDSNGIIKAQKNISSPDDLEFNSLIPVSNGDIIFAGNSDFHQPGGNYDIHLIRTDSLLNFPQNIFGIEPISSEMPQKFILHQNYPNPFNPETKIMFELPVSGLIKLIVCDILGSEVATLVNEKLKAGIYEIPFFANALPSGIYFYKLSNGSYIQSKKMILIK